MTLYTDFVKLHMAKLDKTIPAKERFKMIAKMWSASKVAQPVKEVKDVKAARAVRAVKEAKGGDFWDFFPVLKAMGAGLKEVKAKPAKRSVKAKAVKGGSLNDIHDLSDNDDDDEQPQSAAVINKLKSNVIKRGGYQGFQGHYPDAINESVMQQLVKKH